MFVCLIIKLLKWMNIKENEETKLDDEEMENDHENNETMTADTTVPMDTNNYECCIKENEETKPGLAKIRVLQKSPRTIQKSGFNWLNCGKKPVTVKKLQC